MMPLLSLFHRHDAFGARLAAHRVGLFRVALMWCHDRALADDLAQETLAKALAAARQLRDPDKLRPWLYGILANCWRDHLRAHRPTEDIDTLDEQWLAAEGTPEQALGQAQLARRVRAAIARLPTGQREVLALVDLEACSYAQVAEILALPIGTVMSRLCRARAALRQALAGTDGERAAHHERPALRRVK
jgi:RNA polymerase sigma-70 factor (ECF subfamily)